MKIQLILFSILLGITGCVGSFKGTFFRESYDVMQYHVHGDDEVIIEYHEAIINSSFQYGKPELTFRTNQTPRTVEIEFPTYISNDRIETPIYCAKNGNLVFGFTFPEYNPERDRIFFRDGNGLHEIPFASFRDQPFEKNTTGPILITLDGDPFAEP